MLQEASLARAAATISELKSQGRLEEATKLEEQVKEIAKQAEATLNPNSEHGTNLTFESEFSEGSPLAHTPIHLPTLLTCHTYKGPSTIYIAGTKSIE